MLKINDMFESIQGEGRWSGTPAFFVRFAGCNLACPWCDTSHKEVRWKMPWQHLADRIIETKHKWIVLTGGEPTIQPSTEMLCLVEQLGAEGLNIQVETNGTAAPDWLERCSWITCSPKQPLHPALPPPNEFKLVYPHFAQELFEEVAYISHLYHRCIYITPCAPASPSLVRETFDFVMKHKDKLVFLNLQIHKIIGVP